jgi:hypothetical protein
MDTKLTVRKICFIHDLGLVFCGYRCFEDHSIDVLPTPIFHDIVCYGR